MALFGGNKPDHPMADMKEARKMVAELAAGDPLKALEETAFWLDSVKQTAGFKADYRYQLFDLIDQAGKAPLRKLTQEYLNSDRQEKFREQKLWHAICEYWKALHAAYSQCLQELSENAGGASNLKKDIAVIVGRALRAVTQQIKWGLLRYGPLDDQLWLQLGHLYQFAEARSVADTLVELYPGPQLQGLVSSTASQEFLKCMMLGVSSADGLTPLRQEIAERVIGHFGQNYALSETAGSGCHFFFDLSSPHPPARAVRVAGVSTSRYLGAGKAYAALNATIEATVSKGALPSDINLGGNYDKTMVLQVMQHLSLYWSDQPPARSSERRKIATRLTVVNGMQKIMAMVRPEDDDRSLDFEPGAGESWIVENVSDGGYGAIIPQAKVDWLKVGSVIGVKGENSRYWGAGIIRRLTRDNFQQRRVGIQSLSKAVIPVKVASADTGVAFREEESAMLLASTPDKNGEVQLLMREGRFNPSQTLEMVVNAKNYYLMPKKLMEGGGDFDLARFRVMRKE